MYIPKHFAADDVEHGYHLIAAHPFGTLICSVGGPVPEIAHVPFVLDRAANVLRVHVARANPIARFIEREAPVVAAFMGPHAYVSPSWYEDPSRNVPTWNYAAVHAHGTARRLTERDDVLRDLATLTARYEQTSSTAWSLASADADYVDRLSQGLAAFEIAIHHLDVKLKMSQNRPVADRVRVIERLRARKGPDDDAVAHLVEELSGVERR